MKGVMRFDKKRKHNPIYVVPYKILKRVSNVAYELEFSAKLALVHPVFHIWLLKKCVGDPASIVLLESVAVKDSLSYEDVPVKILNLQVRRLRNKEVASVKKCIAYPNSVLPIEGLDVQENPYYKEFMVQILDRQVKKLRIKEVASVKVLWKNHLVKGETWEAETAMKSLYPRLFVN
ncbi:hypothetical protein EJD97_024146 [Solanum chilense]|uniref:Tf2-1-like SH3-like domain-containing protein n=1 Tax=Solanum chilense TaxID=4083 RepID=A0A6N2C9L7_SOLCI|nr:hypothetical protein EJD97_024146 [Solanum chilense]